MAEHWVLLLLSLLASLFFLLLFLLLTALISGTHPSYSTSKYVFLANAFVSMFHGLLASGLGIVILIKTRDDVLYSKHPYATVYPAIGLGYGVYDTLCMWYVYRTRNGGRAASFRAFLRARSDMIVHHVIMVMILFPVVTYLRNGKGDFFIGCFLMFETTAPFVQMRAVMHELGLSHLRLYSVNGLLMVAVHFMARIMIFPFMFWYYANYAKMNVLNSILHLPIQCKTGCLLLFAFQVYWLLLMVRGGRKHFAKTRTTKNKIN